MLTDDKHLQSTDNIVPAINVKANNPALLAALNAVSASLDTPKLVQLNKTVDVDRKTPAGGRGGVRADERTSRPASPKGPGGKIMVGAANFSENQEIAELYKIALTAAGYNVTVQTIGNRELYEPQLEKNKIQVVPEYAATLTEFLNTKQNGANAAPAASGDIDEDHDRADRARRQGATWSSARRRRPPTRTRSRSPRRSRRSTA